MSRKPKKGEKPKKPGKKPGKEASKVKKSAVKRSKPKQRDKIMAGPDKTPNQREEERKNAEKGQKQAQNVPTPANPREGERSSEINKDKPLTPSGEPAGAFIDQKDPMGTPANSPLSPTEAMRQNQTDEVDLRGSPGAAGEYVPVSGPGNNDTNDMTHEHGEGERADPPPIYTEAEEEDADRPGVKRKK
jgi:hypothetical protein